MKKSVVIGIIIVVIVAIGGFYTISNKQGASSDGKDQSVTKTSDTKTKLKTFDACEIFTLESARQILGEATTLSPGTPSASSDDLKVSNCSYNNEASTVADMRVASVLVRSPLTQDGVDGNKQAFNEQKPATAQSVSGYGQSAFWNTQMHQLNVLKDNNWIIISNGTSNPANNTLEDAKKVADKLSY